MTNREWMEALWVAGRMPVRRAPIFDTAPRGAVSDWRRVEGMLLGLAIGDALGNSSEGWTPRDRATRVGEVRDYLPDPYLNGRTVGVPSDDTQLAFWTVEHLLEHGALEPDALAACFGRERIFGMGSSVRAFRRHLADGAPWFAAAPNSAGNGPLMRIAPVVLPYVRRPSADLWMDAALCARITHDDSSSVSACVGFVALLWELLTRDTPPESSWWADTLVPLVRQLETAATYTPRGGRFAGWEGTLSAFLEHVIPEAAARDLSAVDACNGWYSGAFLLETVPSVLYILMRHGHDPEEAIVRAVNDTVDNDTVAAIVGAAVGALHGVDALPRRWRDGLLGRTRADDDGHVFSLVEEARRVFWEVSDRTVEG
jgi:ADP-ribosylglycohydrolase